MAVAAQTPNSGDRLYKLFILLCLVLLAFIINDQFVNHEHDAEISPIKHRIVADIKRKDSVKEVIVYRDSIRTKLVTKWRNRTDTLTIHEVVEVCNEVIESDSLLISDLRHEIKLSDTIIANYQKQSYFDSVMVVRLNKDLRKQKRRTKVAAAIAILFGGIAAIK